MRKGQGRDGRYGLRDGPKAYSNTLTQKSPKAYSNRCFTPQFGLGGGRGFLLPGPNRRERSIAPSFMELRWKGAELLPKRVG